MQLSRNLENIFQIQNDKLVKKKKKKKKSVLFLKSLLNMSILWPHVSPC